MLFEVITEDWLRKLKTSCRSGLRWGIKMIFKHPSYVTIVIVKWQRASIKAKKSKSFSVVVTMSMELLLIVILMGSGTYICYLQR